MAGRRITVEEELPTEAGGARGNIAEWTVSELSAALKRTVEDAYGFVRVRGEVSGFKGASPSGHCYFRLKDDKAVLEAVIWKGTYGRMRVKPEEGLDVIATGRLTTFPGSSKYQIVIDSLEPAGIGALMKLLEERKKKLAAEGLFDEARKQLLPFLPDVIGVVTSPTGAVIRDILHRLADRFPRRVLVWPVRVQGETSAAEVANAIQGFNALPERGPLPRPDLIIVARGGGSLEDLWSFNEEIVVRAAAASMIPLISAVGPRDRHHADRFRRRQTRADADGGRRNGGAGARRTAGEPRSARRRASSPAGSAASNSGARNLRCCRARCRRTSWRSRASSSTRSPSACRARCAPMRRSITRNIRAWPRGWRRNCCAIRSSAGASATRISIAACARASSPMRRRIACGSRATANASPCSASAAAAPWRPC